jgi:hypothetical protein
MTYSAKIVSHPGSDPFEEILSGIFQTIGEAAEFAEAAIRERGLPYGAQTYDVLNSDGRSVYASSNERSRNPAMAGVVNGS